MTQTKQLVHRVVIKATIQQVWDALTREGEVLPFLLELWPLDRPV